MKLIVSSALVMGLSVAPSYASGDEYKNSIGGGGAFMSGSFSSVNMASTTELDEGGLFISGTFGEIPHLPINAQFIDVDGGYYRADAQYMIDENVSFHAGYSVYEHRNKDQDRERLTEKGVVLGAGYTFRTDFGQAYVYAQREQVFNGNHTLGARYRMNISHRILIEFGFRVNSAIPNEGTLSTHVRF